MAPASRRCSGLLEGQFVGNVRRALDIRFGGELHIVVVDDDHPVFLGEPPRYEIAEHGVDRIADDQHAGQLALGKNRHREREMGGIAPQKKRFAIDPLVEAAGQLESLLRHRRSEGFQLAVSRLCPGQGIDHLAPGIEPDDLCDIRVVLQHMIGAYPEDFLSVGLGSEVVSHLLKQLFIVGEMKTQVLFQPQHVLDQAGAFILDLVLVQ